MSESMGLSDTDKEVVQVAACYTMSDMAPILIRWSTYCTAAAAKTT